MPLPEGEPMEGACCLRQIVNTTVRTCGSRVTCDTGRGEAPVWAVGARCRIHDENMYVHLRVVGKLLLLLQLAAKRGSKTLRSWQKLQILTHHGKSQIFGHVGISEANLYLQCRETWGLYICWKHTQHPSSPRMAAEWWWYGEPGRPSTQTHQRAEAGVKAAPEERSWCCEGSGQCAQTPERCLELSCDWKCWAADCCISEEWYFWVAYSETALVWQREAGLFVLGCFKGSAT